MIFLDSSAIIAHFNEADVFSEAAKAGFEKLERSDEPVLTTSACVTEALARLARWTGDYRMAARSGMEILEWPIEIVRPGPVEERRALVLMESYAEREVSFVDCVSFVVMDARGCRTAFTFDEEHFVKLRKLKPWVPIPRV